MKLIDLAINSIFVFKGDDLLYPYVRINYGFADIFYDSEPKVFAMDYQAEVIKVDRSIIWKWGYKEELNQSIIEERIKKVLDDSSSGNSPDNIESRTEYIFACSNCKKGKRRTVNLNKATDRLCRKCKKIKDQTTGMVPLFSEVDR